MVTEFEEDETNGWVTLDLSQLDPDREGDPPETVPFKVVANRFKSSSLDSEKFLHDPLSTLIEVQGLFGFDFEITSEWTVSTFVVNHHQTLYAKHLYAMASVNPDDQTVGVTIVKKKP
jgi:hypothetical protein